MIRSRVLFSIVVLSLFLASPIPLIAEGYPDLEPESIEIPDDLREGRTAEIKVYIKNLGESFDQPFYIALFIDDDLVDLRLLDGGIKKNYLKNVTFYQILPPGEHCIRILVDYKNEIFEENEDNNEIARFIHVREVKPDLVIEDVKGLRDVLRDGETLRITATFRNEGHEVDKRFHISLRIGGKCKEISIDRDIHPGERRNLSIDMKIEGFGFRDVEIKIDSRGEIEEEKESNNIWRSRIFIYKYLPWFDPNYHYRFLVATSGYGKVRMRLNFSSLMESLGIGARYDPNSTKIVEYDEEGRIANRTTYYYLENLTENGCEVIWLSKKDRYYMIYYDAIENGIKEMKTRRFNESRNATIEKVFEPEGWDIDVLRPANVSLFPEGSNVSILVRSTSKIRLSNLSIYRYDVLKEYREMQTNDSINFSTSFTLEETGNYTLRITSLDNAGYIREKEISVYAGRIDLRIENLSFEERIYRNMPSTINLKIGSNLQLTSFPIRIRINFSYDDASQERLYNLVINNTSQDVSLHFIPLYPGQANVTVEILPPEGIDDMNWSNNKITRVVCVHELPDVAIMDLITTEGIREGIPCSIYALIRNPENEDINARLCLYIAKDVLRWEESEMVSEKDLKLPARKIVNASIQWSNPSHGKWMMGLDVKLEGILDGNRSNNRIIRILEVEMGDREPPEIIELWNKPSAGEVGEGIDIYAKLVDDAGIEDVQIFIRYPDNTTRAYSMEAIDGCWHYRLVSSIPGRYTYYITATDRSAMHNTVRSEERSFRLEEDTTPPVISGIWTHPRKRQLVNETMEIGCVVHDNLGINHVNLTIIYPDGRIHRYGMTQENDLYIFERRFDIPGEYTFFISSTDTKNNLNQSPIQSFWIVKDINDTDNDGIPDRWEDIYGLNPEDPDDAKGDMDGDGIVEVKEYAMGLNPTVPDTLWGLSQYEMAVILVVLIVSIGIAVLSIGKRIQR